MHVDVTIDIDQVLQQSASPVPSQWCLACTNALTDGVRRVQFVMPVKKAQAAPAEEISRAAPK